MLCSRAWCSSCDVLAIEPGALSTSPPEGSDPAVWHYGTYELVLCSACSHTIHSTGQAFAFKARNPTTGAFISSLRVLAKDSATSSLRRCAAHAELVAHPHPPAIPDAEYPAKRSPTSIQLERQASEFALSVVESALKECPPSIDVATILEAGKRAYKKQQRSRRISVYPVPAAEAAALVHSVTESLSAPAPHTSAHSSTPLA